MSHSAAAFKATLPNATPAEQAAISAALARAFKAHAPVKTPNEPYKPWKVDISLPEEDPSVIRAVRAVIDKSVPFKMVDAIGHQPFLIQSDHCVLPKGASLPKPR